MLVGGLAATVLVLGKRYGIDRSLLQHPWLFVMNVERRAFQLLGVMGQCACCFNLGSREAAFTSRTGPAHAPAILYDIECLFYFPKQGMAYIPLQQKLPYLFVDDPRLFSSFEILELNCCIVFGYQHHIVTVVNTFQ